MSGHVLLVRLDGAGDVLLAGPAVRAVAATNRVTMLCGPRGAAAARLLPGVTDVVVWNCPWVSPQPPPVRGSEIEGVVADLAARRFDEAVVLTSFHQSPLPVALLLRLAGVPRIAGASVDHAGALLDVRLVPGETLDEDLPEPDRMREIVFAAGHRRPPGDDGTLAVVDPPPARVPGDGPYVVVHPGAAAPARCWPAGHAARLVELLHAHGRRAVVTGGRDETALTARVAGRHGCDLGGRTDLAELSGVLAGATVVVAGNTAAAHLAAAVGTPVVSLFAPVVPAARWRPYRVPHLLLGRQDAACRDTRARVCPVPGHPCLTSVDPSTVLAAVEALSGAAAAPRTVRRAHMAGRPA